MVHGLEGELRVSRRAKGRSGDAILALIVLAFAASHPAGILALITLVASYWIGSSVWLVRKWSKLRSHELELTATEIIERDDAGRAIGRILLSAPFTFEYMDRATGKALLRLRQRHQQVEFTSEAPAAEQVISSILGEEWPPTDRAARNIA